MAKKKKKISRRAKTPAQSYKACSVECPRAPKAPTSVSDFLAILDSSFDAPNRRYWFRGHGKLEWKLSPTALRYDTQEEIDQALTLLTDFKLHAAHRIPSPPIMKDELSWMQVAQHYGLPTRLLDWTSNAAVALYFACLHSAHDGMVFVMDPTDLNRNVAGGACRLIDADVDHDIIKGYYSLGSNLRASSGKPNVAINPLINTERIQMQRGAFTLHGNKKFELCSQQAPSLMYVPILSKYKISMRLQLERIGIDRAAIFPEPEHICKHLREKVNR